MYLDDMIKGQEHVTYFEPTSNTEKYIHQCDETAGILLVEQQLRVIMW
jgi:hypothetical protein